MASVRNCERVAGKQRWDRLRETCLFDKLALLQHGLGVPNWDGTPSSRTLALGTVYSTQQAHSHTCSGTYTPELFLMRTLPAGTVGGRAAEGEWSQRRQIIQAHPRTHPRHIMMASRTRVSTSRRRCNGHRFLRFMFAKRK